MSGNLNFRKMYPKTPITNITTTSPTLPPTLKAPINATLKISAAKTGGETSTTFHHRRINFKPRNNIIKFAKKSVVKIP